MISLDLFLQSRLPDALEFLREMVGINSFTANREGVNRLARFTAESFAPLGFTAESVPSVNPAYGDHLVLTRRGSGPKSIAMVSHLDTVFPPEEEARNNFRWLPEGDRIYGPGTHDIKGGTAMMWLVLHALRDAGAGCVRRRSPGNCSWNSSEEVISQDFGAVCRARFDAGTLAALVFEAEGRLGEERLMVIARKGPRDLARDSHRARGARRLEASSWRERRRAAWADPSAHRRAHRPFAGTDLQHRDHRRRHRAQSCSSRSHRRRGDARLHARHLCRRQGRAPGPGRPGGDPCARRPVRRATCISRSSAKADPGRATPTPIGSPHSGKQAGAELGISVNVEQRGGLSDGNLLWDAVPTLDGLGPWGDNDHCSERSADGAKIPEFVEVSSFLPKAALNTTAILKLAER